MLPHIIKIGSYAVVYITLLSSSALAQLRYTEKIALVIGVQNYSSVQPLRHSINDAKDIASTLEGKGFKVNLLLDPNSNKEIKDAINSYFKGLSKGTVGIIYYSGHATVYQGVNYLIPKNAFLENPGDLDDQCVKIDYVMTAINSFDNLNILILDACRTNSFPTFNRELFKGLTSIDAPRGSIILFAAQPGKVASDGIGRNGLFTSKLLDYIKDPSLDLSTILKKVKQDVFRESNGEQLPSYVDNSFGSDFYFVGSERKTGEEKTVKSRDSANVAKRLTKGNTELVRPRTLPVPGELLFNMPQLAKSSYCSESDAIIDYDSLICSMIKFESIGAKGRVIGVFDTLLQKPLDHKLYIDNNKGDRWFFSNMLESSFIDHEQNVQFWVYRHKNIELKNFSFSVLFYDSKGNRYLQKATPKFDGYCVSHEISQPELVID
jgi:hypothetical protein